MAEAKGTLTSDLMKAFSQTLSFRKILVMGIALIIGIVVAALFDWVGGLIVKNVWWLAFLAWIIRRIGTLILFIFVLAAMTAVVKMAVSEGAGKKKVGFVAGLTTLFTKLFTSAVGIMWLVIWYALAVLVAWAFGFLGRIPQVGPIIWGICGFIAVVAGLFGVFILIRLFLTSFILPAIISSGDEKAAKAYKEAKRVIKGYTVKLITYLIVVLFICWIYQEVVYRGIGIFVGHTRIGIGKNAPTMSWDASPVFKFIPFLGQRITAKYPFPTAAVHRVGAWIFSIEYGIIALLLLSLPLIFAAIAGANAYSTLKGLPEESLKVPEVDLSALKERAAALKEKVKKEVTETEEEKKKAPPKKTEE